MSVSKGVSTNTIDRFMYSGIPGLLSLDEEKPDFNSLDFVDETITRIMEIAKGDKSQPQAKKEKVNEIEMEF